jgi:hypothetical protein
VGQYSPENIKSLARVVFRPFVPNLLEGICRLFYILAVYKGIVRVVDSSLASTEEQKLALVF